MVPVRLLGASSEEVAAPINSRVWDIELLPDGRWVALLVRPTTPAGTLVRTPDPGQRVIVEWTTAAGPMRAAVTLTASAGTHGPVWAAVSAGPVVRLQRREYFRARLPATITVHPLASGPATGARTAGLAGTVLDIGEGGALVALRGDLPERGLRVETEIEFGTQVIRPDAEVVRRVDLPGGLQGLALRFLDPERYGARIRAALAELQRRSARAARSSRH